MDKERNKTKREKVSKATAKTNKTVKLKKYKSFEHKIKSLVKQKRVIPKKIYPKERCHFVYTDNDGNKVQCKRNAVGKGQLCEKHGGEKRIRDNYLTEDTHKIMRQIRKKIAVYDPKIHPKEMLRLSQEGLSEVEIAAEFKVSVYRLQKWAEDYEDFSEAYDIAKAMYESWWLRKGKDGLDDPRNFNTSLFKYLTGNKLGYAEKVESKNYNINAGVLVVPNTPKSLSEWEGNGAGGVDGVDEKDTIDAEYMECVEKEE